MAIHPFQISDLNWNFLVPGTSTRNGGSYASEFGILPDNINGNTARYVHLLSTWPDIAVGPQSTSPSADSYGQNTGQGDNPASGSEPWRPNGGYYVRGLYFTNTAVPPAGGGFRDGYVGSFVGGIVQTDYSHDPNGSTVDYEPVYGHGPATWPMTADIAHQWLDSSSSPSDGTDSIINMGSALSRTIYMPASLEIFHIDSTGANTTGSGSVKFHIENRASLRMVGFNDGNGQPGVIAGWAGATTPTGQGETYPYASDPLRNNGALTASANDNFHEFYQVTGVRKLNSRGLSFHLAKVFDNGWNSYAYPYEEDGITLGTGVVVSGGGSIQAPNWTQVNNQSEYVWAGGRDVGASIASTSVTSNVVTFTANNTFSTGQIVLIQGLNSHPELNGQLLTVLSSGLSSTQFEANWTHANYSTANETQGGTAVYNPDFRVRNAAVFVINEEYYGFVMDTKCTIWSNKSSMFPMVFFDLADTWTGSTAKRIAGAASVPVYYTNSTPAQQQGWQIFFLSEDGKFARYDFTQTNGVLELAGSGSFAFANNAPAPAAAGEAYGALKVRSLSSPITATSITSNVLTVTTANNLKAGDIVNITGTAESFLNNQTVTVSTASGTNFTAAFTHINYTNASDTGTAAGYELWAVYGTMTADPRMTQTGLANTARIGVLYYAIGTGAWTAATYSANTGRHNARSLSEMISPRDSKLYILCEDVTSTGGGPWTVANTYGGVLQVNWQVMAYDPVAATWNTAKINGGTTLSPTPQPLQYGISGVVNTNGTTVTWVSGDVFPIANNGQSIVINGVTYQVSSWNSTTSLNLLFPGAPIQSGVSYSYANMGPYGTSPQQTFDFWFYNINAFMHDVGLNKILIQPNWTAGQLQVLDVSGSTSALSNSNLTQVSVSTILPSDSFIPSETLPYQDPFSIIHAQDYATNAERTLFFPHECIRAASTTVPIYMAPPSYNWGTPAALSQLPRNNISGNPGAINTWQKDYWSYSSLDTVGGSFDDHFSFVFPTLFLDNYVHFAKCSGGSTDGLPTDSTYGRSCGQAMCFIPTYFKWTGSAWVMADSWTDASTNPYTIGAYAGGYTSTIPLMYGLAAQFGPLSSTSWSLGEFHTWNMCYGNTKFSRKLRSSWAQFAGQTFVNTNSRTLAQEAAVTPYFIDTDPGTASWTVPTSTTPQSASLTTNYLGWTTAAAWNKLDTMHVGFDATPTQLVWTPHNAVFAPGTYVFYPANANIVTGSNPYSWTTNGQTYTVTTSGQSGNQSWLAFENQPADFWQANTPPTASITIQLPSAATTLSYGFRSVYTAGDLPSSQIPTSWQLQGSTLGTFTGGDLFILDTKTSVPNSRGYAFNVTSPGSYPYYRLSITATQGGSAPQVSCFRMSTSVLQTTVNFVDLVLYSYGSQVAPTYFYRWLQNRQMSRGHKFEVSTTAFPGPYVYTTITPLWRAHNGFAFSFAAQTGITAIRITVPEGYYVSTTQTGFGPFYLVDYNASQGTLDAARLGNSLAMAGTAAAASFDPNCLGIAADVPNISIDSANPSLLAPYDTRENTVVHGWWDWYAVQNPANAPVGASDGCFKIHPFFGFVQFQNGGQDGGYQTITGTNASINYQWGRRI